MRFTEGNLKKLESLFKVQGFKIRYEKGSFRSGTCRLLENKVLVVNKFVTTEVKINTFLEILQEVEIDESLLEGGDLSFYQNVKQTELKL